MSSPGAGATGHLAPTLVVVEHVLGPWVDLVDRLVVLSADGGVVADARCARPSRASASVSSRWASGCPAPGRPTRCGSTLPSSPRLDAPRARTAVRLPLGRAFRRRAHHALVDGRSAPGVPPCSRSPSTPSRHPHRARRAERVGKSTALHALAGFLRPTDPARADR